MRYVLLALALAGCTKTVYVAADPTTAPLASPSVEMKSACEQVKAVISLVKAADSGAYTKAEITPQALALRDSLWAVAPSSPDPKQVKFLGGLMGQFANGTFPSSAWGPTDNELVFSLFTGKALKAVC